MSEPFSGVSGAEPASLQRLRALLRDEGGLMASLVGSVIQIKRPDSHGDTPPAKYRSDPESDSHGDTEATIPAASDPGPAQLAASGPRAEGRREDYELLIETIYEGYLLHYGTPRVALTQDGDLALLAGDRLYALGLARLVAIGDIEAVAELGDTITLSALAQGAGEPELAEAVWAAGARAVGWGSSDAHGRAKELARTGATEAIEAMRTSAAGLSASP